MSKDLKRPAGFGLLFIAFIPLKLLIGGSGYWGWWSLRSSLSVFTSFEAPRLVKIVSTPENYDYVMEQIEKKEEEQKTHRTK